MTELRPFEPLAGAARELVDAGSEEIDLRVLAEDPRRRRASFFDGRFLTARDLTREQQYALIRQADLGQSGGGGVAHGLRVRGGRDAQTLHVTSGGGVLPSGELLRLKTSLSLPVRNLPSIERLDASFGLAPLPGEPVGRSSGVFVLALRAVEFTDNPVVAYPTGVDDRRRLEHGEIVEGTAVILIPFQQTGQEPIRERARAELAYDIFLRRGLRRLSSDALPLALVALERGNVAWVDEWLVRRNVGSDEVLGFGLGERALREAFLLQYHAHLRDIELARTKQGLREPFAATEFFDVLPPFGALPRGSVEISEQQVVQSFFPPDVPVELTIVPRDELAALAEDALPLAPFDWRVGSAALEQLPVLICIPLPPELYAMRLTELESQSPVTTERRVNRPTARVLPIQALDVLRRQRVQLPEAPSVPVDLAPWQDALKSAPRLYYVRRRQLPHVSFVVPRVPELGAEDPTAASPWTPPVRQRLVSAGELVAPPPAAPARRFDFLIRRVGDEVVAALHTFFQRDVFEPSRAESPLLINSAVAELAYRARMRLEDLVRAEVAVGVTPPGAAPPLPSLDAAVRVRPLRVEDVRALERRYPPEGDTAFGTGLRALLGVGSGGVGAQLNRPASRSLLAQSRRVLELDRRARGLGGPELRALAERLLAAVNAADLTTITAVATGTELGAEPSEVRRFTRGGGRERGRRERRARRGRP